MTPEVSAAEPVIATAEPLIPSTAGMTTKVVKGSLWTLAGQVTPMAISLVTTPFVIRMLGADGYGVLILIALIPTYLGFADLGMGLASTKFASEAYAEGDPVREARIVMTAAIMALCCSLPIALILFFASSPIISLFSVPEHLHGEAALALKFAAVTFVANFLNSVFNTPQLTRLRMDLNTAVNAGFRILGLIATPFAVYESGVVGGVFALMVASVLTLIGHVLVSGRLNRHLLGAALDRSMIPPMLKFGGALVGAGIAAVLLINTEKAVLAATVSSAALAYYSVAFTLASMLTMFAAAMIQSLVPAFSQLQAEKDREHLNSLYSRGIRLSLILFLPALVVLVLVARPFFTLWAGADFGRESTVPFYILAAGLTLNILAYFPNAALLAAGRADIHAKLYWIELVLYVALVWGLTVKYGIVGAAIAWSIRVVVDAAAMFYLANKVAGTSFRIQSPVVLGIATAMILVPALLNSVSVDLTAWIVGVAIATLTAYSVVTWKYILEAEERTWAANRLRPLLRW